MTRRRDDELDGVTAAWPDDERDVVARLRALPADAPAPDWAALERDIARAVDAEAARPRRSAWLERWWRPALGLGLVATAAAIVIVAQREPARPSERTARSTDAGAAPAPPDPGPLAVGAEGDLDPAELDEAVLDQALDQALDELGDPLGDPLDHGGPDLGLEWVDELDAEQLDAVDRWLARIDDGT